MHRFSRFLFFCFALSSFLTISLPTAGHTAPTDPKDIIWPNLPLACTPQRAGFWLNPQDRPPCHCPPVKSFCPKDMMEWRQIFNRPAPAELIFHCCWAAYTQKKY